MISGLVLAPKESTDAALPFRLPRVRRRQPRPQLIVHGRLEVGHPRPLEPPFRVIRIASPSEMLDS